MQNREIQSILDSLQTQQDALMAKLQTVTDPSLASAISNEVSEVLHRIIIAQNLLFTTDSASLKDSVASLATADATLATAIKQMTKAADVISSVCTYLTYVDKAIDLAKTVGLA